jgi:hypothetical protein
VIADLPDNISAAAVAMAFAAGGACESVETTPLITPEEAVQAMRLPPGDAYEQSRIT